MLDAFMQCHGAGMLFEQGGAILSNSMPWTTIIRLDRQARFNKVALRSGKLRSCCATDSRATCAPSTSPHIPCRNLMLLLHSPGFCIFCECFSTYLVTESGAGRRSATSTATMWPYQVGRMSALCLGLPTDSGHNTAAVGWLPACQQCKCLGLPKDFFSMFSTAIKQARFYGGCLVNK